MAIKIGINGFGRIGRIVLRIMCENPETFDIRGINLRKADIDYMVYLLKYDSVFRNFPGTVEHAGFAVTMTPAFHSSESGCPAGYIIRTPDGLTVYHAGDTCLFSGMALWGQLYPLDVALLPIGGVFTMDAPQAALACTLLGCKSVIPMHWGTFPVLAQSTEAFKQELALRAPDCRCIDLAPGKSISFA